MGKVDFRHNNLDWLRLIFAIQVMISHSFSHIETSYTLARIFAIIGHFPGVPAFFFVSGFLIYAAYDRNQNLANYAKNRFLRLFPGLFAVTIGGLVLVNWAHYGDPTVGFDPLGQIIWFVSQITIGQAYNPGQFRDVGVGVINGVLWTITAEIIFYIAVPVIVFLERSIKHLVPALLIVSFMIYVFGEQLFSMIVVRDRTVYEFLALTPIVWGWMFLFGTLAFKYLHFFERYLDKFYLFIIPLTLMIVLDLDGSVMLASSSNRLGLFYFITLAALILYIAFQTKYIRLDADFSYGIYIWHMVVINFLLVSGMQSVVLASVLTIGISIGSWYTIERPFLRLKSNSIRR